MFRVRRAKRRRSSDLARSQVNVLGQQRDVDVVARIHGIRQREVKADAANIMFDEDDLIISQAFVDEGTTLKRFMPRAQGRAFQILKRTSHITVVVATPDEVAATAGAKKASKN